LYLDYIKYLFKAQNQYKIHSPFVFEFYTQVYKSKLSPFKISDINKLRNELLKDKSSISIKDLGAGSKSKSSKKTVSSHAFRSLKPHKWANLLFNICRHYGYNEVVELGTSFGITSAYLADNKANIITFEGDSAILGYAESNFDKLGIRNITTILGNIDVTLSEYLKTTNKVGMVFFDANHTYQATISYFEQCLVKANENSCFVFDDIYWSEGMKEAWNEIKIRPEVSISIDLFFVGIVFFKKGVEKQNFILI
jgi:predicted O-methyltransferase YrrM